MKISQSLLDLAVFNLSLASTVCAAPSTPSPDALSVPDVTPHFQIDLSVVPTQLSARGTEITTDHSLELYNFFGNEEWAVAIRPGVGPVRLDPHNTNANSTILEARPIYYAYGYGYGGYCFSWQNR
ncbi:uncharacterized protein BDV17DRAFT_296721 [Aspergillus undulatus]|uniref:uncharacterized protein n=1 Tax=Aspergillus undulatus TaxID=1810928 RepID=UPI003CCE00BD